nr:ArsS family sensor histidine kinase [Arcobacter venerupis]
MVINWLINKKHSIFFQINLFFLIILTIINLIIGIQFVLEYNSNNVLQMKKYFSSIKIIEESRIEELSNEKINDKLSSLNLQISDVKLGTLIELSSERVNKEDEPIEIFYYKNKKYIHFKPMHEWPFFTKKPPIDIFRFENRPPPRPFPDFRPENIIIIDNFDENKFKSFWLVILVIIDVLLIWFLIFLQKKLKPLLILKENMIKLSTGNFSISMKTDGKDEISQVSNEFANAVKQLRQLRESRNLFLRNIMHELKTPITKGKLITDMYDDCERKHILIRVFQRLEYLLSEFAKIEELTSGKISLDKNKYHVIDLLEQAFDILLLDNNKIDIEDNYDLVLNVDFELFSIALKNLIDNAITYNTNGHPQIFIEKDYIKIVNKGEKLEKDIEEYYKPFNHEYEDSTSGLGLGLYISNNIIKIHNYKLEYQYINNYHNFVIKLN